MDHLSSLGKRPLLQISHKSCCRDCGINCYHRILNNHVWANSTENDNEQQTAESYGRNTCPSVSQQGSTSGYNQFRSHSTFPWTILSILRFFMKQNIERNSTTDITAAYILILNSLSNPLIYFVMSYYRKRKRI